MSGAGKDALRMQAQDYIDSHRGDRAGVTVAEIAEWLVRKNHWRPEHKQIVKLCASDLSSALTTATQIDPQGREIRAYCCAIVENNGKQQWLWSDVENASYELFLSSCHHRRSKIADDVYRLKTDVESYNDNHLRRGQKPIRIDFDFRKNEREKAS